MAWVYLVADSDQYGGIFLLNRDDGSDSFDFVGLLSDGVSFGSFVADASGNYTEIDTGSNLTVGAWAHLCAVRSSTTSLQCYVNGVAVGSVNTRNVSGRSAATRMEMGGGYMTAGYGLANVRAAHIKIWTAALTEGEIYNEMTLARPIRSANLHIWSPGFPGTQRTVDYSGNGYDWTAGGTLTDEDPPAVAWGAGRLIYIVTTQTQRVSFVYMG
jgi:hypothetical protein